MIGIIPAAGKAERMGGIPKFLLPVPGGTLINVLANRMIDADLGVELFALTRRESFEAVLDNTPRLRRLGSLSTQTMSQTVLCGLELAKLEEVDKENVLFGMPDTYWEAPNVYEQLSAALSDSIVAAALFRARPGQRLGMCATWRDRITGVIDKPEQTSLKWAWGALAWRPEFWQYIKPDDPHVGFALARAPEPRAVCFEGNYWDCGTPNEYFHMIRHLTKEAVIE